MNRVVCEQAGSGWVEMSFHLHAFASLGHLHNSGHVGGNMAQYLTGECRRRLLCFLRVIRSLLVQQLPIGSI